MVADDPAAAGGSWFARKNSPHYCAVARLRGCAVARLRGCAVARLRFSVETLNVANPVMELSRMINRIALAVSSLFAIIFRF